jgi:hypothetical protein
VIPRKVITDPFFIALLCAVEAVVICTGRESLAIGGILLDLVRHI